MAGELMTHGPVGRETPRDSLLDRNFGRRRGAADHRVAVPTLSVPGAQHADSLPLEVGTAER
jgi:hypothetical protein